MDGLHREASQLQFLPGDDLHKAGLACQVELLQLVADQTQGQPGAIDRQVHLLQQIGDAADVVLVAVGDQQPLDLVLVLQHKGEVGDDHIHPIHLAVGEHQAAVHNDHIAAALIDGHILAHFPKAAQRVDVDGHCRAAFRGLGPAGPAHRAAGALDAVVSRGAGAAGAAGRCASVLFCCHVYLHNANRARAVRPLPKGRPRPSARSPVKDRISKKPLSGLLIGCCGPGAGAGGLHGPSAQCDRGRPPGGRGIPGPPCPERPCARRGIGCSAQSRKGPGYALDARCTHILALSTCNHYSR